MLSSPGRVPIETLRTHQNGHAHVQYRPEIGNERLPSYIELSGHLHKSCSCSSGHSCIYIKPPVGRDYPLGFPAAPNIYTVSQFIISTKIIRAAFLIDRKMFTALLVCQSNHMIYTSLSTSFKTKTNSSFCNCCRYRHNQKDVVLMGLLLTVPLPLCL